MQVSSGLAVPIDAGVEAHPGWIHSPAFDLLLFTLSPLSGIAVALMTQRADWGRYIPLLAVAFVASPHYLSTFTFFLDDANLAYYRTRWAAFFAGPVVCAAVVAMAITAKATMLFQAGVFTWNLYHVALQSAGILGIYRTLNSGPSNERPLAVTALIASAAAMVLVHADRFPPLYTTLLRMSGVLPPLLLALAVIIAVPAVAVVAFRMARRRAGASEVAFFVSSVLLFHPYLWVKDSELATLAMLMGHFVQYLTIVWLVHHRKYLISRGSFRQRALAYVSGRTILTLGVFVSTGVAILALERGSRLLGISSIYLLAWNMLVLMHFYLDGLIWSFRYREIRESIGSYLILPGHRRS